MVSNKHQVRSRDPNQLTLDGVNLFFIAVILELRGGAENLQIYLLLNRTFDFPINWHWRNVEDSAQSRTREQNDLVLALSDNKHHQEC